MELIDAKPEEFCENRAGKMRRSEEAAFATSALGVVSLAA